MATVHVTKVTEGWPEMPDFLPQLTTIDLAIDGKYVRMGYYSSEITSASDTQTKLTADASIITDADKQHDAAFPAPIGGTDKPDYIPDDFDV